jgi:hypothetical protein
VARPSHIALVLALGAAGCGGAPEVTPPPESQATAAPAPELPTPEPSEPPRPVFDPGDLDQVAAVYRRVNQGDLTVFEEVGLTGDDGLPDPAKVEIYYQAIAAQRAKPETWDTFLARAGKP